MLQGVNPNAIVVGGVAVGFATAVSATALIGNTRSINITYKGDGKIIPSNCSNFGRYFAENNFCENYDLKQTYQFF